MPARNQKKMVENIVVANKEESDTEMEDIDVNAIDVEDDEVDGNNTVQSDEESDGSDAGSGDEGDFGVEEDDVEDENGIIGDDVDDDGDDDNSEFDDDDADEDEDGEVDGDYSDDEGSSSKKGGAVKTQTKGKRAKKESAVAIANDHTTEVQYGIESDDEDDVEYEKFEEDTREQYLLNFHPEARSVSFEEVKALCAVTRDADGDIIDAFHTTIPVLTKYEKARILGLRAKQLNSNIRPAIPVKDYVIDSYRIAEMELEEKKIPFIIRRPLPDGRSEYWRIEDLTCVY